MRYLSVNRSGTNGENPDKSRIFHLPVTNWLKPGQNPDISEKPPGQGPKKRTCPGKPGRMVSLLSSTVGSFESMAEAANVRLLRAVVASDAHVPHQFFPPVAKRTYNLRPRKHLFLLPTKDDRYFVSRILFK